MSLKVGRSNLYRQQESCDKISLIDDVVVAVINWDMTDEMNSDNVVQYVADAFEKFQKSPIAWNHRFGYYRSTDERKRQRELKLRVSNATRIWIIDYNSEASLPLDGLESDYYVIKKNKEGNVGLVKSKSVVPCSTLSLDSDKLPASVDDEPITFVFLEDLVFN